ncbi:MAG: hypothetical protein JSV67_07160 [Thermoplasmatales archaeon]|nr:MAG: hypothetical protein JSV67_07160 [Thermoplasmatales archaeon]
MAYKLKKTDIGIIVVLIIIARAVLLRTGYVSDPRKPETPTIEFFQDDSTDILKVISVSTEVLWKHITIEGECDRSGLGEKVVEGNMLINCEGTITLIFNPTGDVLGSWTFTPKKVLPESIIPASERVINPEDEGKHYNKLLVSREWWYFTAIFNEDSELPGWAVSISFNHMSRTDLFIVYPDILFITLHSPDGEKYGGIIERERPILGDFSFLKDPVLQASYSDDMFRVSFEKSYVQGQEPNWHIHIEGNNIDKNNHKILMDLQFFAPSSPLWIHNNRLIQNTNANIASYVFVGCDVSGTIEIDGFSYNVEGVGHHEHTWASGIISKGLIRGWDWSHMKLDNGWNIYYSNYYILSQFKSTKEYTINPLSTLLITSDKGEKLTILDDIEINILQSDKVFLLLNIPLEIEISAKAGPSQILLKTFKINLDLNLKADNTLDNVWKKFAYVGMKIGRAIVSGQITWSDDNGDHIEELNGISTIWNMRH